MDQLKRIHETDPLHGIQMNDILSFQQRFNLVCVHPTSVRSLQDMTKLMEETDEWAMEWATSLFNVISQYDQELQSTKWGRKKCVKSTVDDHVQKKLKTANGLIFINHLPIVKSNFPKLSWW